MLPLREALLGHALYQHVGALPALRVFMQHHVFAVWDFMSLLKTLQRELCCVAVPWLPPADPVACRLVNEVVLGEESDEDGDGGFASHFDLYRRAMARCGADTAAIDGFLRRLRQGSAVGDALAACAVASAFALGREDLLPDLFRRVIDVPGWAAR
jgi:hypothetical protein